MIQRISADVTIIGGGLVGSSAALAMRKAGLAVVLIDKGFCGAQASGVNYGGVRRQGRPPEQLPLSQRAHGIWPRLKALVGIDGEYVPSGHLKLARTEADFAKLEAYAEIAKPYGLDLELVGAAALKTRFPWLSAAGAGASLCPGDGHANPRLVSPAFARAAERAGVKVFEQTPVHDVRATGSGFAVLAGENVEIRSRQIVNSAGAWSDMFAAQFGERVPLTRIYPSMVVTEPLPMRLPVSMGEQGGSFYGRQVARGNYVMGGGRGAALADPDFSRPSVTAASSVMQRAIALFPHLATAQVIRFWSGTEAEMPDGNPVIGASQTTPGLFHAFGFCGAGFQIAPAVGEVLLELVATGQSTTPIDAFSIGRFSQVAAQTAVSL
ncbi:MULTISPECIES: FAD-dependent oxidoreductase [Ensifer]|uniref:NAD(P)/FAD-dependent oxidoreductase n=1 Tax=Ensifer TaxID=106591 RepID=UPI00070BD123|nr:MULTISPECIES: FAD-dependent oxidoreductase [Ensifer]KQW50556.1 FAD-dependent oxidoreductase [Ensifer sp. Root1252]KRC74779.1 FAD-dependent oxidoreductase [Ensifer sp. Root231]KRC94866.1 FAD-dependent oxidoreductase [Ensifer sp. Root258]NOV16478.1 FAD-binding oxidoreductase [Ensifer canadensis]PSS60792.1 FAD-binding oxidoreductase [Ensifer sp. NM-2]